MAPQWLLVWVMVSFLHGNVMPITFSVRLIHRFYEEMKVLLVSSVGGRTMFGGWAGKSSMECYEMLVTGDFLRHKMKLRAQHQLLFPSHGSKKMLSLVRKARQGRRGWKEEGEQRHVTCCKLLDHLNG